MTDTQPERRTVPTHTVVIPDEVPMVALLGPRDELLRTIERAFPKVDVHVRGNEFRLAGDSGEMALVERLVDELLEVTGAGQPLNREAVERSIGMLRASTSERPADVLTMNIVSSRGRTIRPKTLNQKHYVDAIDRHTIVFGLGPAGTGKTYLAMAKAVAALHDMVDPDSIPRLMAAGTIEVAPLAFMRGRSLNSAFIILDEAQNTSPEQMKMFLTRLGFASKMVVTGDTTQVDLPGGTRSGLNVVREILDGVEDIHFAELTSQDVVRHRLVSEIVDAYGRYDARRGGRRGPA